MSDSADRERARTCFERPVLVEAGAGTGKTTTLVARILTWCLGPGWELEARAAVPGGDPGVAARVLDGVVAITFTEAAAAEMAGRVGEALLAVSRGEPVRGMPPPEEHGAAARGAGGEAARDRARALLDSVERLTVSTIHAFCGRILATAAIPAGLHPEFRVDADGSELREMVHEKLVDFFTEVFAGPSALQGPLGILAEREVGSAEIAEALCRLAAQATPAAALEGPAFSEASIGALMDRAAAALGAWLLPVERATARIAVRAERTVAARDAVGTLVRDCGGPRTMAGLLALSRSAAQFEPRSRERLREHGKGRFNKTELALFGRGAEAIAQAARDALPMLDHLASMDPELLDAGRELLAPLLGRVRKEMTRRGVLVFEDLLRGARDLLRHDPEVRRRVRGGIRQLLVDEFQDTDAVQCDLVRMLAFDEPDGPGDAPALFVVGDPKQSIYGWRSADLLAYQAFADDLRARGGLVLSLDRNLRSLQAILDEVQAVVEPQMGQEPGWQPAFVPLSCGRAAAPPPPAPWTPVEHWVSWTSDDDGGPPRPGDAHEAASAEASALARDLVRLHATTGLAWEDVGILMRATSHLELYLRALREAGVPYVVERDRNYFRRREIVDAAAILRCVLDPLDTLATLTALRSPAVGVPDAALLPLWRLKFPLYFSQLYEDPAGGGRAAEAVAALDALVDRAAEETARSGAPGLELLPDWPAMLKHAVRAVASLREQHARLPADTFVDRLRALLPLEPAAAARHLGDYRVANLQRFHAELVPALERAAGDPHAVLRTLRAGIAGRRDAEDARPSDAARRAVRVMTIHKAKGLDFRHVYLVQTHAERREGGRDWKENVGEATRAVELADSGAAGEAEGEGTPRKHWEYRLFSASTPGWDAVERRDARVEHFERLRLLYVAMTRAKDRLVLLGNWPAGGPPQALPVERAASLLELIGSRRGGFPQPLELAAAGEGGRRRDGDVTWRMPAAEPELEEEAERRPGADTGAVVPEAPPPDPLPTDLAERQRRRARVAEQAEGRMRRPSSGRASDAAHRRFEDESRPGAEAAAAEEAPGDGVSGAAARGAPPESKEDRERLRALRQAAGTAVHRALEHMDPALSPEDALSAALPFVSMSLAAEISDEGERSRAHAQAASVLRRFVFGELGRRFRALQLVARELPTLAAAGGAADVEESESPVGFVAGAIDLLAADPATGEFIVVDYKTDAVRDESAMAARAESYRPQAEHYGAVLQEALRLPRKPRLELWFLAADRVLVL